MRISAARITIATIMAIGGSVGQAEAQAAAGTLSGSYRCEPQPVSCQSGQTFSVSQTGNSVEIKNDKGDQGNARLTSGTTLSAGAPWNMIGVVHNGEIEWSNGTKWRKQ